MRQRTQYQYTDEQLAELYKGYNTDQWWDHRFRVDISVAMIRRFVIEFGMQSVADLSAGDGRIVQGLSPMMIAYYLGDFAHANVHKLSSFYGNVQEGKIEETVNNIPPVDLFILSETIEHVENPDILLAQIASKARYLFLSTPLDETPGINPEHYWSWGKDDMSLMLKTAGFYQTVCYSEIDFFVSRFQVWLVSK